MWTNSVNMLSRTRTNDYSAGDVIVATDPFKDDDTTGRPFLLLDRTETPFHGE